MTAVCVPTVTSFFSRGCVVLCGLGFCDMGLVISHDDGKKPLDMEYRRSNLRRRGHGGRFVWKQKMRGLDIQYNAEYSPCKSHDVES